MGYYAASPNLGKKLMRHLITATLCALMLIPAAIADDDRSSAAVLKRLQDGNARYVSGKSIHARIDAAKRMSTAVEGQKPYATILGCSDSRVPPEMVFDQGFADLFIIRVAGNVCGESELASAEYGAKYLGTNLIVVLGHSQCGAVEATLKEKELAGSLPKLAAMIRPAIDKLRKYHPDLSGDRLFDASVEANVRQTMNQLMSGSPVLRELVESKNLKIAGAIRDLKTGQVRWLPGD